MSDFMEPAISTTGAELEKQQALRDAQAIIWERGHQIQIRPHVEASVTRDRYNNIIKRNTAVVTPITMYAFPILYNPTDKQSEEAGIREKTEVLIKTAVKDWTDNSYTVETLKDINSIKLTVIINGAEYEIRDKQLDSQFNDIFLYIHLGLNRI